MGEMFPTIKMSDANTHQGIRASARSPRSRIKACGGRQMERGTVVDENPISPSRDTRGEYLQLRRIFRSPSTD